VSGFDARLLVWVKPRKAQHEKISSALLPIADILGGLRFGFVNLQQVRLLFHNDSLRESEKGFVGCISTIEQVNSAPNPVASDPHRKGNNPPLLRYLFSM
jgi:hypothetical protein